MGHRVSLAGLIYWSNNQEFDPFRSVLEQEYILQCIHTFTSLVHDEIKKKSPNILYNMMAEVL